MGIRTSGQILGEQVAFVTGPPGRVFFLGFPAPAPRPAHSPDGPR